jgi:hypothetical protein
MRSHATDGAAPGAAVVLRLPHIRLDARLRECRPELATQRERTGRLSRPSAGSYDLGMLGVHYAVTAEQERALLAADGDSAVGELVEELDSCSLEYWSTTHAALICRRAAGCASAAIFKSA